MGMGATLQNVPLHAYKQSSPNHKKERHPHNVATKKPETSLYEEQRWFQGAWTYTRFTKKEKEGERESKESLPGEPKPLVLSHLDQR